jgi:hypothetical protein
MTKKSEVNKDKKYNQKRKPIFRVEAVSSDTTEAVQEMYKMKFDIINHSKTAKQGVIDIYRFAKENGFFDK